MKIIITEKQVDNLLGGMLNNMFKDFEIKYNKTIICKTNATY